MGDQHQQLKRELGVGGATMMGLGSIVGTGVFVSIGIGAGVVGPAVVVAIALAGLLAMCNAMSSAQLAANHPVSGGTYEYGYEFLRPSIGFTAGWMFLCAKSASAATAAIGAAGYTLRLFGNTDLDVRRGLAIAVAVGVTVVVLSGLRRSNVMNIAIVSITLVSLGVFVLAGMPSLIDVGGANFEPFFDGENDGTWSGMLTATALMFVAYTGYGRIATLGEEVREPRVTIPRAIVSTLVVSATAYIVVAIVAVGVLGADGLAAATRGSAAPLEEVAVVFDIPGVTWLLAIGAVTAMLGVLLNLILGLSRVALAMGRRRDLPGATAKLDAKGGTPWVAVLLVGVIVTGLAAIGSVETTWTFSAFTVLIYYAITNLAALQLTREQRLYPRAFSWCGLLGCAGLAFWVDARVWAIGVGLIGVGLVWHGAARMLTSSSR